MQVLISLTHNFELEKASLSFLKCFLFQANQLKVYFVKDK